MLGDKYRGKSAFAKAPCYSSTNQPSMRLGVPEKSSITFCQRSRNSQIILLNKARARMTEYSIPILLLTAKGLSINVINNINVGLCCHVSEKFDKPILHRQYFHANASYFTVSKALMVEGTEVRLASNSILEINQDTLIPGGTITQHPEVLTGPLQPFVIGCSLSSFRKLLFNWEGVPFGYPWESAQNFRRPFHPDTKVTLRQQPQSQHSNSRRGKV